MQLEVEMVEESHRDRRLQLLDPCTDPGPTVSDRLYSDRVRRAELLVRLDAVGATAARVGPPAVALARRARG